MDVGPSDGRPVALLHGWPYGDALEVSFPGYMGRRVESLPAELFFGLNLDAIADELQAENTNELPDACRPHGASAPTSP